MDGPLPTEEPVEAAGPKCAGWEPATARGSALELDVEFVAELTEMAAAAGVTDGVEPVGESGETAGAPTEPDTEEANRTTTTATESQDTP